MKSPDFKEGNVNDLVLLIILPVIGAFILWTTSRPRSLLSLTKLGWKKERYLFIVEAKRSSLGAVMVVSMKDIGHKIKYHLWFCYDWSGLHKISH